MGPGTQLRNAAHIARAPLRHCGDHAISRTRLSPLLFFHGCKGQRINVCSRGGEPGDEASDITCTHVMYMYMYTMYIHVHVYILCMQDFLVLYKLISSNSPSANEIHTKVYNYVE